MANYIFLMPFSFFQHEDLVCIAATLTVGFYSCCLLRDCSRTRLQYFSFRDYIVSMTVVVILCVKIVQDHPIHFFSLSVTSPDFEWDSVVVTQLFCQASLQATPHCERNILLLFNILGLYRKKMNGILVPVKILDRCSYW